MCSLVEENVVFGVFLTVTVLSCSCFPLGMGEKGLEDHLIVSASGGDSRDGLPGVMWNAAESVVTGIPAKYE